MTTVSTPTPPPDTSGALCPERDAPHVIIPRYHTVEFQNGRKQDYIIGWMCRLCLSRALFDTSDVGYAPIVDWAP